MKTVNELKELDCPAKWMHGFCHIYAQALLEYFGDAEIGAVFDNGGPLHVFVRRNRLLYDAERKGRSEEEVHQAFQDPKSWIRNKIEYAPDFSSLCQQHGIRCGETGDAHLYFGPELPRLLGEARVKIENDTRFGRAKGQAQP